MLYSLSKLSFFERLDALMLWIVSVSYIERALHVFKHEKKYTEQTK